MNAVAGSMGKGGCPVTGVRALLGRTNRDWWPDALAVDVQIGRAHV